jgi:hypothetical protein
VKVAFDDPQNARVLAYLRKGFAAPDAEHSSAPPSLDNLTRHSPGTDLKLVERLWHELTVMLPEPCAWVVYARPVLVHPSSGLVFGFALGAHTYALKLDEPELAQAVELGARRLPLGRPWTLGDWRNQEVAWCLAAYRAASTSSRPGS